MSNIDLYREAISPAVVPALADMAVLWPTTPLDLNLPAIAAFFGFFAMLLVRVFKWERFSTLRFRYGVVPLTVFLCTWAVLVPLNWLYVWVGTGGPLEANPPVTLDELDKHRQYHRGRFNNTSLDRDDLSSNPSPAVHLFMDGEAKVRRHMRTLGQFRWMRKRLEIQLREGNTYYLHQASREFFEKDREQLGLSEKEYRAMLGIAHNMLRKVPAITRWNADERIELSKAAPAYDLLQRFGEQVFGTKVRTKRELRVVRERVYVTMQAYLDATPAPGISADARRLTRLAVKVYQPTMREKYADAL